MSEEKKNIILVMGGHVPAHIMDRFGANAQFVFVQPGQKTGIPEVDDFHPDKEYLKEVCIDEMSPVFIEDFERLLNQFKPRATVNITDLRSQLGEYNPKKQFKGPANQKPWYSKFFKQSKKSKR